MYRLTSIFLMDIQQTLEVTMQVMYQQLMQLCVIMYVVNKQIVSTLVSTPRSVICLQELLMEWITGQGRVYIGHAAVHEYNLLYLLLYHYHHFNILKELEM